jgi:hypothetical protein
MTPFLGLNRHPLLFTLTNLTHANQVELFRIVLVQQSSMTAACEAPLQHDAYESIANMLDPVVRRGKSGIYTFPKGIDRDGCSMVLMALASRTSTLAVASSDAIHHQFLNAASASLSLSQVSSRKINE